jgi:autotransporter-associated beta strand protein
MKRLCLAAGILAFGVIWAPFASAQSVTWSTGVGTWSNPASWSGGATPTASNDVFLTNNSAMTIGNGVTAVANSVALANAANGLTLTIANGGRLNVTGAITDTGAGTASVSVSNTTEANAASILTASSITANGMDFNSAGTQFLSMGSDITLAVQLAIGNASGTATYRQTGGTLTTNNGGYGLTLIEASSANPTGTATFILDGGRVMSDRIGVANGNGNNGGTARYAASGSFVFNSGTIQPPSGRVTYFQNGSARTSGTTTDTQYDTSKPVTISLAGTGTHEFNATGGNIFITPSAQLRDKAGEAGTLLKTGASSLILTGNGPVAVNDWTGASTVNAGTLSVDYNQIAGTATSGSTTAFSNAYSAASQLVLNGGNFTLTGRPNATASSQTNRSMNANAYNLTVTSTAGLVVGQAVTNANLPAGTYIRRITNATTVELNAMITGTTNVTGQTFDFAAASFTNSQTINSVSLQQSGTVTVNPAGDSTVLTFGTVAGSAGFTKAGTGVLRLTGPVSYTGTTTISAGTLEFAPSSGSAALGGSVVGTSSGALLKTGNGTTIIGGTGNTFAGALSVTGGTLQIGNASTSNASTQAFASIASVNVGAGANLVFKNSSAINSNAPITLSGTISTDVVGVSGGGFVTLLGALTMSGGSLIANLGANSSGFQSYGLGGDVTVSGGSPSTISAAAGSNSNGVHLAWNTVGATRTFTVADVTGDAAADLSVSATLLNAAANLAATNLAKAGVGTMLLSGSNGYTGSTTVSAGMLDFSTVNALRNSSGVSIASDTMLRYSGATSGTLALSISGAGGFTQSGAGALALTGSNGFTGVTSLNAGTLALASANALAATGTMSFGGGTLQYGTANQTDFSVIIRSSTGAIAIDTNSQTVVFASTLDASNTGGLSKSGAGTLRLTNATPGYSGTTAISEGTLEFASSSGSTMLDTSVVGTSSGTLLKTGAGTMILSGTGNTFAGALSVTGGTLQIGNAAVTNVATQQFGSVTSVNVGVGANLAFKNSAAINSGAPITLSGTISTDMAGVSGGNGFVTALGALTMSGGSLISNLGANNTSFQSYALGGDVTVTGASPSTISAAAGSTQNGVHLAWVTGTTRVFNVADVTSSAAADLSVSAPLIDATSSLAASGLRKTGAGTILISSTSTYSGATQVAAGTLIVNGRLANTSGVTVDAGATLGGSGVIAALATVNGTLSPGNSPGEITLSSLALGSTATTLIEITGTTRGSQYDGVTILTDGGLGYGGSLSFDFGSLFDDNTTFDIFSFTGTPTGSFTSIASTGSYAGTWTNNNNGTYSLQQGSQTLTFSQLSGDVVIVPEPTALMLIGIGAGLGGVAAWRRRRAVAPRR